MSRTAVEIDPRLIAFVLPSIPESVRIARFHVRAALGFHGLDEYADDAEIITSELVTNAVQHVRGNGAETIGVALARIWNPAAVTVVVSDSSPEGPIRCDAPTDSSQGRGLQIVEALSAHWGWRQQDGGKAEEAGQQEARLLQRTADLGIDSPTSGFSPKIENEKADDTTHATAKMLKAVMPASIPSTSIYRMYSAVTHGEIYGLMNFMAPGVTSDGSTLLHWHLPPEVLDSTIQMAITAFGQSYRRIAKVMGWGKLEGDLWEIKLSKIYGGQPRRPRALSRRRR